MIINVTLYTPGFYPDTANDQVIVKVWDTLPSLETKYHYYVYNLNDFSKTILHDIKKKLIDSIAEKFKVSTIGDNAYLKNKNVENIKYFGRRITGNKLYLGNPFGTAFSNTGLGSSGSGPYFVQYGFSYFEIVLKNQITNFKLDYQENLRYFFEINNPHNDTLYFKYQGYYRVYLKKE